jgi:hypothetical protein
VRSIMTLAGIAVITEILTQPQSLESRISLSIRLFSVLMKFYLFEIQLINVKLIKKIKNVSLITKKCVSSWGIRDV